MGTRVKQYRPHILVAAVLAVVLASGWHSGLRNALADLRFTWLSQPAGGDIVVVAIDAPSIEKVGVWPWPRRLHAELLRQLESAGVNDVVFDVDFSTPSDPKSDQAFLEALRSAGGSVVLPSFKQPGTDGTTYFNRPLKPFLEQAWTAIVNVSIEPDGLVRRYAFGQKLDGEFLPSMGAVLAEQFDAKRAPFLIDFGIRSPTIPRVSFIDVLDGDVATLSRLKGNKIIVGGTALELGDRFSVPNGGIVSGPVLQALAAESILRGRALHWTSATTTLIGLGLGPAVVGLLVPSKAKAASGAMPIPAPGHVPTPRPSPPASATSTPPAARRATLLDVRITRLLDRAARMGHGAIARRPNLLGVFPQIA